MKFVIITILVVLGLGGVFFITQSKDNKPSTPALTMQVVQTDVSNGGQLIDVRTAAEYDAGHIDGAINLPLQDIQQDKLPSAEKDKMVYVYCHSGNRSGQATVILKNAGYQNIVDLGAMTKVESIGGKVVKT